MNAKRQLLGMHRFLAGLVPIHPKHKWTVGFNDRPLNLGRPGA